MHRILMSVLAVAIVITAARVVAQPDVRLHYKIYHSATQKEITMDELMEGIEAADVLIFGEEHDDSIAHVLQHLIYRQWLEKSGKVTLSLEMFETDCQVVLNEYLAFQITENNLIRDGRVWNNYKDYRPMVELARQRGQKVIAANAPRRYVSLAGRNGLTSLDSLSKESKQFLPKLPLSKGDTAYYNRFKSKMNGHGGNRIDNMYEAQTVWDATMAGSIYQAWKRNKRTKIFHLNGRFHSDGKWGVVWQLKNLSSKINILTISCFPTGDFANPNWPAYRREGDFIIVTDTTVPRSFKQ
jgi:uncharacterized iron-regulated protein